MIAVDYSDIYWQDRVNQSPQLHTKKFNLKKLLVAQ